jgi:nucleotide-binding universal stress UspA family protein
MDRPTRILLAVRVGSESAGPGRKAAWLARKMDAELILLYVATELATATFVSVEAGIREENVRERMVREARERAERWGAETLDGYPFRVEIGEGDAAGDVASGVATAAEELEVDLVVVGTESRSALRDILLGDTTREILRRTPCPVVVVPARQGED